MLMLREEVVEAEAQIKSILLLGGVPKFSQLFIYIVLDQFAPT
jgi:bacterioferritin (cytochrome b1)